MNDLRQFFALLEENPAPPPGPGECVPPMDVVETTEGIEILLDVPGVRLDDVSVTFSRGAVVVSGRKMSGVCEHGDAAFHLAERGFGHFARAVRLNGAFNAARATASLAGGELRIVIPRVEERRGQDISIRVTAG